MARELLSFDVRKWWCSCFSRLLFRVLTKLVRTQDISIILLLGKFRVILCTLHGAELIWRLRCWCASIIMAQMKLYFSNGLALQVPPAVIRLTVYRWLHIPVRIILATRHLVTMWVLAIFDRDVLATALSDWARALWACSYQSKLSDYVRHMSVDTLGEELCFRRSSAWWARNNNVLLFALFSIVKLLALPNLLYEFPWR